MKHTILILLALCTIHTTISAQRGNKRATAAATKLENANLQFEKRNYQAAIPLYLKILDSYDIDEAKIKVAECYRHTNNWSEAEYWYGQVVNLPNAKPIYSLYLGKALQANGKCDLAKEWFEEYARLEPDDLRGHLLALACDNNGGMVDAKFFCKGCIEIEPLPFNTEYDDYSPSFYKDQLVFSRGFNLIGWYKHFMRDWSTPSLYYATVETFDTLNQEYTYSKAKPFIKKDKNKVQACAVFPEDDYMFLNTASVADDIHPNFRIWVSKKVDEDWKIVEGVPFNSDEYCVAYPTFSKDRQTLYFASDMPGGFGGMDLYYSKLTDGVWGMPINAGPRVNTEGHEIFPFFHQASSRLYFASDGQTGKGGFDIYYADIERGLKNTRSMPSPLNTRYNDYCLILNDDETFGYFTSDRRGGMGNDDIYGVKMNFVNISLLIINDRTRHAIENVQVDYVSLDESLLTNQKGQMYFQMPLNDCKTFTFSKEGYKTLEQEICTDGLKHNVTLEFVIVLKPDY